MEKTFNLDTVLVPGQKVRIVVIYDVSFEVDISDYLGDSGDNDITVEQLHWDIERYYTISDIVGEFRDVEETVVAAKVIEIL